MYHFGLLASIAMAAALVGDLVLLPNLLSIFDADRRDALGKTAKASGRRAVGRARSGDCIHPR
jgi:hypothetical protein